MLAGFLPQVSDTTLGALIFPQQDEQNYDKSEVNGSFNSRSYIILSVIKAGAE